MNDDQPTALVLTPVADTATIVESFNAFQRMKRDLLAKEDMMEIQGKPRILKSGWRKIATAFGISDQVMQEERRELRGPEGDVKGWVWEVTARATSPGGRFSEAVGACSSTERKFAHPEHDTLAMAHTRAKNRAIADLVGGGENIAEELEVPWPSKDRWDRFFQAAGSRFGYDKDSIHDVLGMSAEEFVQNIGTIEDAWRMLQTHHETEVGADA